MDGTTCKTCERETISTRKKKLPFELVAAIFEDGHLGISLWRCQSCERLFVKLWIEWQSPDFETEDLWRYFIPISEDEAQLFCSERRIQANTSKAMAEIKEMARDRGCFLQSPGSQSLQWMKEACFFF